MTAPHASQGYQLAAVLLGCFLPTAETEKASKKRLGRVALAGLKEATKTTTQHPSCLTPPLKV